MPPRAFDATPAAIQWEHNIFNSLPCHVQLASTTMTVRRSIRSNYSEQLLPMELHSNSLLEPLKNVPLSSYIS